MDKNVRDKALTAAGIVVSAAALWGAPADQPAVALRLTTGVARTLDRTSAKAHDRFDVRATEGQTLVLELNPCCPVCFKADPDQGDKIGVASVEPSRPEDLASRLPSDELFSHWMNVLPHSGVYRITIDRPSRKHYQLRVTLMDPEDPRLDPGITADRVLIGPDLLHAGKFLTVKPYEPGSFCEIDSNWPAYLGMEDYGFGVEIMQVEGLKKAWWGSPEQLQDFARLESALIERTAPAKPPLNTDNDARLYYWAKPEFIETESLRALRWVAEYTNGDGPLTNPLEYMVQAISQDRRYFIQIRAEVEYLNPSEELTRPSDKELAQLDVPRLFDAFQRKVNAALSAASPDSFKPSLARLDAALRAIELR